MTFDLALLVVAVVAFGCGWLGHWQWSRAWESPEEEGSAVVVDLTNWRRIP